MLQRTAELVMKQPSPVTLSMVVVLVVLSLVVPIDGSARSRAGRPTRPHHIDVRAGSPSVVELDVLTQKQRPDAMPVSQQSTGPMNELLPYDPVANASAIVVSGNARFTVLTARLIRMEWSANGAFEDRAVRRPCGSSRSCWSRLT